MQIPEPSAKTTTSSEQVEGAEQRRLFDIRAAVDYLRSIGADGASVNFVRTLISTAEVPFVRVGKKFYLTRQALDDWLHRHERRAKR